MNKKNKKIFFAALGIIACGVATTVTVALNADYQLNAEETHEWMHYDAIRETFSTCGSKEYWVCCDCHQMVFSNPGTSNPGTTPKSEIIHYLTNHTDDPRYVPQAGRIVQEFKDVNAVNWTNGTKELVADGVKVTGATNWSGVSIGTTITLAELADFDAVEVVFTSNFAGEILFQDDGGTRTPFSAGENTIKLSIAAGIDDGKIVDNNMTFAFLNMEGTNNVIFHRLVVTKAPLQDFSNLNAVNWIPGTLSKTLVDDGVKLTATSDASWPVISIGTIATVASLAKYDTIVISFTCDFDSVMLYQDDTEVQIPFTAGFNKVKLDIARGVALGKLVDNNVTIGLKAMASGKNITLHEITATSAPLQDFSNVAAVNWVPATVTKTLVGNGVELTGTMSWAGISITLNGSYTGATNIAVTFTADYAGTMLYQDDGSTGVSFVAGKNTLLFSVAAGESNGKLVTGNITLSVNVLESGHSIIFHSINKA